MIIQLPEIKAVRTGYAVIFDPETLFVKSIKKNRNIPDDENYLETTFEDVKDIIEGKESIRHCRIVYDIKTKQYQLARNNLEDPVYTVSELIYRIPETNNDTADLQIIQDIKNTCWKILMGNDLRTKLTNQSINVNMEISLSVTEGNNPNILYRTLKFSLKELMQKHYVILDFKQEREFNAEPISLYTIKRFDTYSYEVIK